MTNDARPVPGTTPRRCAAALLASLLLVTATSASAAPVTFSAFGGRWKAKDGELQADGGAGPKLLLDAPPFSTGEVGVEILFPDAGAGNAGLIVKVSEPGEGADRFNGYEVALTPSSRSLLLGRHRQNFEHIQDSPCDIPLNRWIPLVVKMTEKTLEVLVDGRSVVRYEDRDHPLASGQVGLRTWQRAARYRNPWVQAGGARQPVPFEPESIRVDETSTPLFIRYDDPRVRFTGPWQPTVFSSPESLFGMRSDEAGASVELDVIGTSADLLNRAGGLGQGLVLFEESGRPTGLARVEVDGRPASGPGADATIDTSRAPRTPLARGLAPGRHRVSVTNLGHPAHPGGSTAVVVAGFWVGVEKAGTGPAAQAWSLARTVRGGNGWRQRAAEMAAAATDAAGLACLEELVAASRELEEASASLRSLRAEPPPSPMVALERRSWTPRPETQAYLDRLAALTRSVEKVLAETDAFRYVPGSREGFTALMVAVRRAAGETDAFFRAEARALPPLLFFTGSPLKSDAVPNAVWQSQPHDGKWGCSIRLGDPSRPDAPAKILFEDPKSLIFDLNLSFDAKTVFFSMRRNGEQCWQIWEMGIDGSGLKQITRGPHYNVCPVPLPDGRLAFLSSRTPGYHTVCQSGPSMHVHVMDRDGSNARDLSTNTLTDFGLSLLQDGRLIFTRWEYVDVTLTYRQSLWTESPDGRRFQLYQGNTVFDPPSRWQAREIPGRDAVVCTFAPHHHSPHGAIGLVTNRNGVEAPRDTGFRWITREFPSVLDLDLFWSYRDPCPVGQCQFLVSYGGGGLNRFRICLLDEMDNRVTVYDDPSTSCFHPLPVVPRPVPAALAVEAPKPDGSILHVPAAPPGQPKPADVPLGRFVVSDVYAGVEPAIRRGEVASIRIMEQLPKTVDRTWHFVYDQGPLMGAGSYYAKRLWGYAPVEADGSAYFEAPAGKELYFQICDAEGRELQRMTSAAQLMPGETQSCIGCHENRAWAPPRTGRVPLAVRRPPTPLRLPPWGNAGILDYNVVVQPVLDRNCVRCHGGSDPAGGVLLVGDYTRFFNMSYDQLVIRSRSDARSRDLYTGRSRELPMVQTLHLLNGIQFPYKPRSCGSLASRLPSFFTAAHCRQEVPADDRRLIHEWIDAMVPYYATTDYARTEALSNRDKWGQPDSKELHDWYTKGFTPVFRNRCASCHGDIPDREFGFDRGVMWSWIDLTKPEWSPALTAHLAKAAGGRGIPAKGFQFKDATDPDYQAMSKAIAEGCRKAREVPEADMPGFVSRSQDRAYRYR